MKYFSTILGLLALITTASARADEPQAGTEQDAAGGEVDVGEEPSTVTLPLHNAGAQLALEVICHGEDKCQEKYGEKITKAAYTVVDACLEDPEVPKYMCLGLVANASIESGLAEHPTCGGINQECVLRCDTIDDGGARQACFIACAKDDGIKGDKLARVAKCNDKGSSKGPFQMKLIRIGQCKVLLGPDFSPFNLRMATKCTIAKIKKTALSKHFPCGKSRGDRWMIAMKQVGAGPTYEAQAATPAFCLPSPIKTQAPVCVQASPAKRATQCGESTYASLGYDYYLSCGKKCSKWTPPAPSITQDP